MNLGVSGGDGRFKIHVPVDRRALHLVARAMGVGSDFVSLKSIDPAAEVELRTVEDQAIRGRVVDTQGKPVAEAQVVVTKICVHADDSLDTFLAAWKVQDPNTVVREMQRDEGVLPAVRTDADGRFTLAGAGKERLVTLRVRGPRLAESELLVVNRGKFDPKPYNNAAVKKPAGGPRGKVQPLLGWGRLLFGPELTVVVEAEKPILGVVKDADTGQPCAGVQVRLTSAVRDRLAVPVTATTDVQGRFNLHGVRKAETYFLRTESKLHSRHLAAQVEVADTVGVEPITAGIMAKRGVIITGKILDQSTGKPIRGFATPAVLLNNPFVKQYPGFDRLARTSWSSGETAEDGTFRILTVPGPVLLIGGVKGDSTALTHYKQAKPDPKYPQYFEVRRGQSSPMSLSFPVFSP